MEQWEAPSQCITGLKQRKTLCSPIRTSQKQPCPASHSQGRHRHGQLQWLYCGQESGSKLSSVITAFVCALAGQSLGNVFPSCHSCTSGVTSTHASQPPFAELTWGLASQPWDGSPSTCCGVFSELFLARTLSRASPATVPAETNS